MLKRLLVGLLVFSFVFCAEVRAAQAAVGAADRINDVAFSFMHEFRGPVPDAFSPLVLWQSDPVAKIGQTKSCPVDGAPEYLSALDAAGLSLRTTAYIRFGDLNTDIERKLRLRFSADDAVRLRNCASVETARWDDTTSQALMRLFPSSYFSQMVFPMSVTSDFHLRPPSPVVVSGQAANIGRISVSKLSLRGSRFTVFVFQGIRRDVEGFFHNLDSVQWHSVVGLFDQAPMSREYPNLCFDFKEEAPVDGMGAVSASLGDVRSGGTMLSDTSFGGPLDVRGPDLGSKFYIVADEKTGVILFFAD